MKFAVIPVTPFRQNCSLVWCEATGQAALIDPGGEPEHLLAAVARHGLNLDRILLTHGHIDHVGAAGVLAERLGIAIEGPQREDAFLFDALPSQCAMFGFPRTQPFRPGRWLNDGDRVQVGEVGFDVLHCPGHTPGHVVFYQPRARQAFVGDVLFKGSIGRTDLVGGHHDTLIDSIRRVLFALDDDVEVYSGHGPITSIGLERMTNPFLLGR